MIKERLNNLRPYVRGVRFVQVSLVRITLCFSQKTKSLVISIYYWTI
jgi:hypothetical protein